MRLRYIRDLPLLVFILSCLSCSDIPLGPIDSEWVFKAVIPGQWFIPEGIACSRSGSIYVVGRDQIGVRNVIYKYDGSSFAEDFVSPYRDSGFSDIDFYNDTGYAVGYKSDGPYMVRYDGSEWNEVVIGDYGIFGLYNVSAISDSGCWLTACISSPFGGNVVPVKYAGGVFKFYNGLPDIGGVFFDRQEGTLYCLNDQGYTGIPKAVISADEGNTWIVEEIILDYPACEILAPNKGRSLYVVDGVLYFNVRIEMGEQPDDVRYNAIIKRTGPPGDGEYELVFMAPEGPYFTDVRALAFRDKKHGLAVGYETSVVYERSKWLLENTADSFTLNTFEGIVVGSDGYWAFGSYAGTTEYRLFYHP